MHRTAVDSTTIASMGYDEPTGTLELEFANGALYQYFDVPEPIWHELLSAESAGAYFNTAVRGHFRYARV